MGSYVAPVTPLVGCDTQDRQMSLWSKPGRIVKDCNGCALRGLNLRGSSLQSCREGSSYGGERVYHLRGV